MKHDYKWFQNWSELDIEHIEYVLCEIIKLRAVFIPIQSNPIKANNNSNGNLASLGQNKNRNMTIKHAYPKRKYVMLFFPSQIVENAK